MLAKLESVIYGSRDTVMRARLTGFKPWRFANTVGSVLRLISHWIFVFIGEITYQSLNMILNEFNSWSFARKLLNRLDHRKYEALR